MQSTDISYNDLTENDVVVDDEDGPLDWTNYHSYLQPPQSVQSSPTPQEWWKQENKSTTSLLQSPVAAAVTVIAMIAWQFQGMCLCNRRSGVPDQALADPLRLNFSSQ
jgi:hypothetical protein